MYVCVHVYAWCWLSPEGPLELELKMIVDYHVDAES